MTKSLAELYDYENEMIRKQSACGMAGKVEGESRPVLQKSRAHWRHVTSSLRPRVFSH